MAAPVAGKNLQLPIDPPPPGGWGGQPCKREKIPHRSKKPPLTNYSEAG
jgi:hypothetical protein